MRKTLISAVLVGFGIMSAAHADYQGGGLEGTNNNTGGFQGPNSTATVITVEQAKTFRDDARVTLRGNIIERVGDDDYMFKDKTGSILVDIDHDKWLGVNVKPSDLVEIRGKVDKDWNSVEIDVKSIKLVK